MKRFLLLAGCVLAQAAQAHVTLLERSAAAGTSYKAVLTLTHGCEGSPVRAVTVRVPAGLRGAKPMPKPGWTLQVIRAALATPYTSHGKLVTEDTVELRWTAQSQEAWLQDAWFDEFTLRGQLPATPGPLWFKVRQDCERGAIDWSEVPAEGTSTRGLKAPAVLLEVRPAGAQAGHAH